MDKPLYKQLVGDGSAPLYAFARNKLRQMNALVDGPPYMHKKLQVGNSLIVIDKGATMDRIQITTVGGYVASVRYQATYQFGQTRATGERTDQSSDNAVYLIAPRPVGTFQYNCIYAAYPNSDGFTVPLAGWMFSSWVVWDGTIAADGYTKNTTTQLAFSRDLGKTYFNGFQWKDHNRGMGNGHSFSPFRAKGVRGLWFVSLTDVNGSSHTVQTIARVVPEGRDYRVDQWELPSDWTPLPYYYPIMALAAPDTVFGLYNEVIGPEGGPYTSTAYLFVKRGTDAIQRFNASAIGPVEGDGRALAPYGTCRLYAVSASKGVVLYAWTGRYAGAQVSDLHYTLFLVDFDDGTITTVLEGLDSGWLVVMGQQVLLYLCLERLRDALGTGSNTWTSVRYLSLDNGRTWAKSPAMMPNADGDTSIVSTYYLPKAKPVVTSPYVSPDSQGVIYMPADYHFIGDSAGEQTDMLLFRSTDLAQSWQPVATILKYSAYPSETTAATPTEPAVTTVARIHETTFAPIGSESNPLPIDGATPWRCDDSFSAPDWWTA